MHPAKPKSISSCAGFTLLEGLVVLLIFASILAVSVPAWYRPSPVPPAPPEVQTLKDARAKSLATGRHEEVVLAGQRVVFYPDGTATAAKIILTDAGTPAINEAQRQGMHIIVTPFDGRISWQEHGIQGQTQ